MPKLEVVLLLLGRGLVPFGLLANDPVLRQNPPAVFNTKLNWRDAVVFFVVLILGQFLLGRFGVSGGFIGRVWECGLPLFWYFGLRRRFPIGKFNWKGLGSWWRCWLVVTLLALLTAWLGVANDELVGKNLRTAIGFLIDSGLIVGLAEELAFRGVIQTSLNTSLPQTIQLFTWHFRLGTVLAALLFGVWHYGNFLNGPLTLENFVATSLQVLFATTFGLLLGQYYDKTGNLWGAIILHNANDFINALVPLLK